MIPNNQAYMVTVWLSLISENELTAQLDLSQKQRTLAVTRGLTLDLAGLRGVFWKEKGNPVPALTNRKLNKNMHY